MCSLAPGFHECGSRADWRGVGGRTGVTQGASKYRALDDDVAARPRWLTVRGLVAAPPGELAA
jgi:hypothetical protein